MNYKKSEIVAMKNEEVLSLFYKIGAEEVKEINFKNGAITNKTLKLKQWVLEELEKRFDVDRNRIKKEINI